MNQNTRRIGAPSLASGRIRSLLFALGVLAGGLASGTAVAQASSPVATATDALGAYAKSRLIVGLRAGVPDSEARKIATAHGGRARSLGGQGLYVIDLPARASEVAVRQVLTRHPQLKFAELDRRVAPSLVANDPYMSSSWHLAKVAAPQAWDRSQGAGITIAILDSGVDSTHPDLAGRVVPGWNLWDNNSDTRDVLGHGTAVAGTAAATVNNAMGVAGLAGAASIMPIRICGPDSYAYFSTIAQGITYAADKGARVASISYANLPTSAAVVSAAQYMKNKGGLVVVSAGNNAKDEGFTPTSSMIVAAATDRSDALTSFSSWGAFVTIAAPGIDIWTTNRGGGYGAWWGTSFATPNVAGALALAMAANRALSASQVESLLYTTAQDLGAPGRDSLFGHGRINAEALVAAALNTSALVPDTTPPSVLFAAPASGAAVAGVTAIDVLASDAGGVAKVELRANGVLVGTDATAPFGFSLDSSRYANGTLTLTATAVDVAGNSAAASQAVTVSNPPPPADTLAPVVTIVSPKPGVVRGTVSISSTASDNAGAAGLTQRLFINGTLRASSTGSTLSFSWNTRKVAAGSYTLQVVARDAAGNSSQAAVTVSR